MDLDNNIVTVSEEEPLPVLPSNVLEELKTRLGSLLFPELNSLGSLTLTKETENTRLKFEKKNETDIRMCFLAFHICLFRNIPKFVNAELEDTDDIFDIDNYLATQVIECEPFWEILLSTMMFQIFTQKLASPEEATTTLGLFIELSEKCSNFLVKDIFDTVINHALPSQTTKKIINISLQKPKLSSSVAYYWNPHQFPMLDSKLMGIVTDNSSVLKSVDSALKKSSCVELHILRVYLLMQRYHINNDKLHVHSALVTCSEALTQEEYCIPVGYIYSLLNLFTDEELEGDNMKQLAEPIQKVINVIIENRKYSSIKAHEPALDVSNDMEYYSGRDIDLPEVESLLEDSPVLEYDYPWFSLVGSFRQSIRQIHLPPGKTGLPSDEILHALLKAKLITDDARVKEK